MPACLPWLARPSARSRSWSGSGCRPRSWRRCSVSTRARFTQDPNPLRVGAAESKFLYPPPPRPRRRATPFPPPSQRPLHLGRAPWLLSQLCSSPHRPGSGRSGSRREVAARGGGCWDQAAGLREDTWGRRGRRRKKGAGLQFSGLPPTSPGEAGTSPGSRRPRTGHGGRTEPPSPVSPPLQEGGGGAATPFGVGERSFSLWFYM